MNDHSHNAPDNCFDPLNIGHSNDGDIVKAMHRAGQRVILFVVAFEELPIPPETRDYRPCLDKLWTPFLKKTGLSAGISNQGWYPERGLVPAVIGHVWRQHGTERLDSVTEEELDRLCELLRAPESRVIRFTLTELTTTEQFGKPHHLRKLSFLDGNFINASLPIA